MYYKIMLSSTDYLPVVPLNKLKIYDLVPVLD